MKVLLVTQSYPPVLGGLQQIVHDLARGLVAKQHWVQVVTQHHPRNLPANETIDGVPVRREFFLWPDLRDLVRGRPDQFAAGLVEPLTQFRFERLIRSFAPDVIHYHYPQHLNRFVVRAAGAYPARLVVSFHGVECSDAQAGSARERDLLRAVLHRAECITAVSSYTLEQVLDFEPGVKAKAVVVPNGLPETIFFIPYAFEHPHRYIFAAGRLVAWKDFDVLIEAFSRVAADNPEFDLLIAGEGPQHSQLEAQIERLSLTDRVRLLGNLPRSTVGTLLRGCQFTVVPSGKLESFGLVALEAMAMERRVIVTNVGGLPEAAASPDNQIIDPGVDSLSAALQLWLADPAFQPHSPRNRDRALTFRLPDMIDGYERCYQ